MRAHLAHQAVCTITVTGTRGTAGGPRGLTSLGIIPAHEAVGAKLAAVGALAAALAKLVAAPGLAHQARIAAVGAVAAAAALFAAPQTSAIDARQAGVARLTQPATLVAQAPLLDTAAVSVGVQALVTAQADLTALRKLTLCALGPSDGGPAALAAQTQQAGATAVARAEARAADGVGRGAAAGAVGHGLTIQTVATAGVGRRAAGALGQRDGGGG